MGTSNASPTSTITPLLLRNFFTSLITFSDKFLVNLTKKYKLLELIHALLISSFLFFLRLLPSLFPSLDSNFDDRHPFKPPKNANYAAVYRADGGSGTGDVGVARALTQLLSIINRVPVNSSKYEVVRSLAEKLIDENHREGVEELRGVNRAVLSAVFDRTINQIEGDMLDLGLRNEEDNGSGSPPADYPLFRVMKAVRTLGDSARSKFGRTKEGSNQSGSSAEKLAAELLWLAQKMSSCGCGNDACSRWASAAHLARLSILAEPRLQGSLVKVAAFMFKQARDMGMDEEEESEKQKHLQTKFKMLLSWLPLLCRGSKGTDTPILSIGERRELETILEEMIWTLQQDEQEQVLALWLNHFTCLSSSDWPNLHASYARWYNASRKLLIHQNH